MLKLPKEEKSVWRDIYPESSVYPRLDSHIKTDVTIIGAGITGLSAAYELHKAGKKVVILEKDSIGSGTTGRTTGKVTSQHELAYTELSESYGPVITKTYAQANQAGVERIQNIIKREKFLCEWEPCDNYVFTDRFDNLEILKREAAVAKKAGLPASFETDTPLPFTVKGALKFSDQAKFHPQKYLLGLAKLLSDKKVQIFEDSRALGIDDGTHCDVTTKHGAVESKHIIVATHIPTFPLVARAGYALLAYPTESFFVAGPSVRGVTDMYISPDKNHHSILPTHVDGKPYVLVVGAGGNIPGLGRNTQKRYQMLAHYAEKRLGVEEITHRWSDMDYTAYDDLPLVGKLYPWSKHIYTATGFRKWGLAMGASAGKILADQILQKPNEWASAFDSTRGQPIKKIPRAVFKNISKR